MPTLPKDIKNIILDFKAQLKWTSKIAEVNRHIRHKCQCLRREDYKELTGFLHTDDILLLRLQRITNIMICEKKGSRWLIYELYNAPLFG